MFRLGFLIRHQFTLSRYFLQYLDINLSTVYEIYVSFRKFKDQGIEIEGDYGSHLDGAYNFSNLRLLVPR